jgi:hypothetical protein
VQHSPHQRHPYCMAQPTLRSKLGASASSHRPGLILLSPTFNTSYHNRTNSFTINNSAKSQRAKPHKGPSGLRPRTDQMVVVVVLKISVLPEPTFSSVLSSYTITEKRTHLQISVLREHCRHFIAKTEPPAELLSDRARTAAASKKAGG